MPKITLISRVITPPNLKHCLSSSKQEYQQKQDAKQKIEKNKSTHFVDKIAQGLSSRDGLKAYVKEKHHTHTSADF